MSHDYALLLDNRWNVIGMCIQVSVSADGYVYDVYKCHRATSIVGTHSRSGYPRTFGSFTR